MFAFMCIKKLKFETIAVYRFISLMIKESCFNEKDEESHAINDSTACMDFNVQPTFSTYKYVCVSCIILIHHAPDAIQVSVEKEPDVE